MKTMVISYSSTGNNEALAAGLAAELTADHVRITERKNRTMGRTAMDVLLNRTPAISMPEVEVEAYNLVLFVGPVWMGQVATPFRACFKQLGARLGAYGFVSISGGADGPNPKLAADLTKRLAREPTCLIDLHIADILPPEPEPTRDDTMAYRLTQGDVRQLTKTTMAALHDASIV